MLPASGGLLVGFLFMCSFGLWCTKQPFRRALIFVSISRYFSRGMGLL